MYNVKYVLCRLFFLRFSNIDSAQAALDKYEMELELRPAAEKTRNRSYQNVDKVEEKSTVEATVHKMGKTIC